MDIESGNANDVFTAGTGWFIGYSEWAKSDGTDLRFIPELTCSRGVCMKWMNHPKGDSRGSVPPKPISAGRTVNMIVSTEGQARVQFSLSPHFPEGATEERTLRRHGDFCAWGPDLYHRTYFDADCTILTLRWTPEGG